MVFEFRLPDIGEGIAEAEIVEWLVSEGDSVKSDQTIIKVETDKAVADLPSPVSGTILKINFSKGDTVNVGAVLCVIGDKDENIDNKRNVLMKNENKVMKIQEDNKSNINKNNINLNGKVLVSPVVRKIALEKGFDLTTVKGSGVNGQILISDLPSESKIPEIVESPRPNGIISQKKYDQYGYVERIPMKGVRKVIAQNMINSLSRTAQVTAMEDIGVTKLWDLRLREKEHFAIEGVKLTFMPFVINAVIKALQKFPKMNSSIEGENIVLKKYYNIGVAVQTDVGLMVPVIKIAERKSISEIAKEIESLAEKCRDRTIDTMDLKGSTFTITNYGSIGGTYATPIINPGESAILGLGKIFDRAVLDNSGSVKNVKILPISLTFDHQIVDGAEATQFIIYLKELLESPDEELLK
ncbi:MAG: dihydrolipoamide acetyltransferase family protein [Nanoarchaeota archaeon]